MGKRAIEGLDKAKAVLGDFSWMDFTAVRRFSLDCRDETYRVFDIDLVLESERRSGGNYSLHLRFRDVSGLSLTATHQIAGLTIENIADRQWERKNWQIGQIEDTTLEFCAADVSVISLTPL